MMKRRIAESVARWLIGLAAGAGIVISPDMAADIAAGAIALAMLGWSIVDKYRNRD